MVAQMGKLGSRPKRIEVSNHALFRWLDRTGVVDVEALRTALSAALDRAAAAASAMGEGEYLILSNGLVYVVRNGVVVTVLDNDSGRRRARQCDQRPALDDD